MATDNNTLILGGTTSIKKEDGKAIFKHHSGMIFEFDISCISFEKGQNYLSYMHVKSKQVTCRFELVREDSVHRIAEFLGVSL